MTITNEFPGILVTRITSPFSSPVNKDVSNERLTEIITQATSQILHTDNPLFHSTCARNPHWENCQIKANQWVKDWNIASERYQQKYAAAKFSRLMAGAHPRSSEKILEDIVLLVTFLFVYDDQNEKMTLEQIQDYNPKFLAILSGSKPEPQDEPIFQAFAEILNKIKSQMPSNWYERFKENFKQQFESTAWEATNRKQDRVPALEEYLKNRQNTGAVKVVFDLIEMAEGIRFDNVEYELFEKLIRSANLIICLANDIFGTHREYKKRDNYLHNIVCVLENHDKEIKEAPNSLEKAAQKAVKIHNDYVQCFKKEEERLLMEHSLDDRVPKFIQAVKDWIWSHYVWSIETERCLGKTISNTSLQILDNSSPKL